MKTNTQTIPWCMIHNRKATHTNEHGEACCDPELIGLKVRCFCEDVPVPAPSVPVESVSEEKRVETVVLNPEWITADFEWPSGNPTPWTVFFRDHYPKAGVLHWTVEDMKAAFRAGYEAGRKAK